MKIDRRSFLSLVIGAAAGTALTWKSWADVQTTDQVEAAELTGTVP